MTRGRKIAAWIGACLAGLIVIAVIAGIIIVRTDWFRNMVREKIITAVEEATGGKVDIASFSFDWTHLRAQVRDFVIHGLEPPTAPPLMRAKLVQVDLKLTSPFTGFVNLAYLLVDEPRANIIVFSDGKTNIPAPKIKAKSSDKTGLETIVDLAVGKFDLRNGYFIFDNRQSELNATGSDLRAQVGYNALNQTYKGELDISPLYVKSGANTPLNIAVRLPFSLEKDKVSLADAQLNTGQSQIKISGSMEHLVAPRTTASMNANLALDELKNALGLGNTIDTVHGPHTLVADASISMDDKGGIKVEAVHAKLGQSDLEASGVLKDVNKPGSSMDFKSTLSLTELGRLMRVAARPTGEVKAGGHLTLDANNDYRVNGKVDARGVSFQQGTMRITGVSLDSDVSADPHRIQLADLHLNALGGGFSGSASVEEMQQFTVAGNLRNFDIDQLSRLAKPGGYGYDGIVSGPVQASGNLKDLGPTLVAKANLGIAPGRRGIPVSGHLGVDYNGRSDTIVLDRSHLALPHTAVDLSGSLGKQIQIHLVSRNFSDFQPLGDIPVTFTGPGAATVDATVSGNLSSPRINGHVGVTNFAVRGRAFTSFGANLAASSSSATVSDAVLTQGALRAQFSGTVGMHNWKPENTDALRADATVRNADLRDILALADQTSITATGIMTADAHISGTVGSPVGTADVAVGRGTIEDSPFDSINAHAALNPTAIDLQSLSVVAGPSRIDANAHFQHPVNDMSRGTLQAHVNSNQVQLAQFQALVKDRPGLRGVLSLNGDVAASVSPGPDGAKVDISNLNANASARGLELEGKGLGDFTATASSAGTNIRYNINSNLAGSTIHVEGQSAIAGDHETSATASIANLPIDRVLALAGRRDLAVRGTLSANGTVSGTLQKPQADVNVTVVNGAAFDQPFTRIQAAARYSDVLVDVPRLHIEDGPSTIDLTASFNHPSGNLNEGDVRFHVASSPIQLTRVHQIAVTRPGLTGIVQLTADGAATLHANAPPTVSTLNANVSARNIVADRKDLGNLTATATTRGNSVQFNLDSDLGKAQIHGAGHVDMTPDYPVDAKITLAGVTLSGFSGFMTAPPTGVDASLDGQLTVNGSVAHIETLRGGLLLTKLEAHSVATANKKAVTQFEVHNNGNVQVTLANSLVTVDNFKLTGPYSNLSLSGTASLKDPGTLKLQANGNVQLAMLESIDKDIDASGAITLNAAISGTTAKPNINGQLQLQNASFNMLTLPNGLSNANGTVTFSGTEAIVNKITGETGGGQVTLTGHVSYGGPEMQFRLQANAANVHVNAPDTVTTGVDATINIAGTSSHSLASGKVTIRSVSLHSSSDVGSILSSAAPPPSTGSATTGIMAGMKFDIRIQTAPDVQFHTTLSQNLQADADLTLRGTIDNPGMLGRVNVTSGDLVFFGAKYTVDQGSIAFYDPYRINPILRLDLGTTVQGIDVTISVSGSIDRMKLAYHSDPPLEFQQIVSLLASGKVSVTDPVLAAHQPPAPEQNVQQAGMSTVLGQVANPVSGRLQRLFGVSKLSISPQVVGETSNNPQATLTLQQQITRDITFTYIQDVTQSTPSAVRIEWAINPRFSAIAQRDVYGVFALDFFYKKRFH